MSTVTTQLCQLCGSRLLPNDRFCSGCGARASGDLTPLPRTDALLERLRAATLGLYDVHSELGRGGMAAVYLAYDLRLQRKVAIKVMLPELFMSEGMAERFLQEARTAARLSHPHIVVIYGVSDAHDLLYFVMGVIEGAAVDDILRLQQPLPAEEAKWILGQAARALQHAHNEGVVHRDVKPANIMVNVRGDAILTDFGIAKASEAPNLTKTGSSVGTPAYMSPEQVMALTLTGASDQYSLGVVAYELLSGATPFRGSALEVQWAHAQRTPPDLASIAPLISPELAHAVMRMLAKAPEDRWPSLDHLIDVFTDGVAASGGEARRSLAALARAAHASRSVGLAPTPRSPLPAVARSFSPSLGRTTAAAATSGEAVVAANDIGTAAAPARATHLLVTPSAATLHVGESVSLGASARHEDPTLSFALPEPVQWRSDDDACAACDTTGVVFAHAAGSVRIVAQAGALSGSAEITVLQPRVARVAVNHTRLALHVREQTGILANPFDRRDALASHHAVSFASSDVRIVTVDDAGEVTAIATGSANVVVRCDEVEVLVPVDVTAAPAASIALSPDTLTLIVGDTDQVRADIRDDQGDRLGEHTIVWDVEHPAVAVVSASGVVRAVAAGTTRLTASCDGVRAAIDVVVALPALRDLVIVPAEVSTIVGRRVALTVRATSVRGDAASTDGIMWTSSDPSIATVHERELRTHAAGATQIAAQLGACSATMRVLVTVPVPTSIAIISPPGVLRVGASRTVRVEVRDAEQQPLEVEGVAWASSDAGIATVDASGVVRAIGPGACTIAARVGALAASLRLEIAAPRTLPIKPLAGVAGIVVLALVGWRVLATNPRTPDTTPQDSAARNTSTTDTATTVAAKTDSAMTVTAKTDAATPDTTTTETTTKVISAPETIARRPFTDIVISVDRQPVSSQLSLRLGQSYAITAVARGAGRPDSVIGLRPLQATSVFSIDRERRRLETREAGKGELVARVGSIQRILTIMVQDFSEATQPTTPTVTAPRSTGVGPAAEPTKPPAVAPTPVVPPVVKSATDGGPVAPPKEPTGMSAIEFESWVTAWLGEKGQNLAAVVSGGNNRELDARLKNLDSKAFRERGGLRLESYKVAGSGGSAVVSFPGVQGGGIPGTYTIRMQITFRDRSVTEAVLLGSVSWKAK